MNEDLLWKLADQILDLEKKLARMRIEDEVEDLLLTVSRRARNG